MRGGFSILRASRFDWFGRGVILALMAFSMAGPMATHNPVRAAEEAKEKEAEKPKQPFIIWVIYTSGSIGAILFCLSTYFIATVAKLFKEVTPQKTTPLEIVEGGGAMIDKRDFKGVYGLVKQDTSHFSALVKAGMAELSNGLNEARGAMERRADVLAAENEKKISLLAVLGTLGPMIGLLGTLKGMIASFSAIATSDTQLKASEVAEGISEALLLTFEGVALSVPAIYFYAFFKNRIAANSGNSMLAADEFLGKLASAARSKSGPPAAG